MSSSRAGKVAVVPVEPELPEELLELEAVPEPELPDEELDELELAEPEVEVVPLEVLEAELVEPVLELVEPELALPLVAPVVDPELEPLALDDALLVLDDALLALDDALLVLDDALLVLELLALEVVDVDAEVAPPEPLAADPLEPMEASLRAPESEYWSEQPATRNAAARIPVRSRMAAKLSACRPDARRAMSDGGSRLTGQDG